MDEFTIEFVNFSLFVHHSRGLTVIPGASGHTLEFAANALNRSKPSPVPKGAEIALVIRKGKKFLGVTPTAPCSGVFMPNLSSIFGRHISIDPRRVVGKIKTGQLARIHLHGGNVEDRPASGDQSNELAKETWSFQELSGRLDPRVQTNRAIFRCPLKKGWTYELTGLGKPIKIKAGARMRFKAVDNTPCRTLQTLDPKQFYRDRELPRLLKAVGIDTKGRTAVLTRPAGDIVSGPDGSTCQPCGDLTTTQYF